MLNKSPFAFNKLLLVPLFSAAIIGAAANFVVTDYAEAQQDYGSHSPVKRVVYDNHGDKVASFYGDESLERRAASISFHR